MCPSRVPRRRVPLCPLRTRPAVHREIQANIPVVRHGDEVATLRNLANLEANRPVPRYASGGSPAFHRDRVCTDPCLSTCHLPTGDRSDCGTNGAIAKMAGTRRSSSGITPRSSTCFPVVPGMRRFCVGRIGGRTRSLARHLRLPGLPDADADPGPSAHPRGGSAGRTGWWRNLREVTYYACVAELLQVPEAMLAYFRQIDLE